MCTFRGLCCSCTSLVLWIEIGEMHIDPCNVLAEENPGKVFAITDWLMEIYRMVLPGMGMGGDMELGRVTEILD